MQSSPQTAIVLAPGFEETEAVTVVDVLRRAEIDVTVASLAGDSPVRGSHELEIGTDAPLSELSADKLDLLVLPGGMPGAKNLSRSDELLEIIREMDERESLLGAICAAPLALHAAGVLEGRKATCYPSFRKRLTTTSKTTDARVQRDGHIITSQGPATAILFALQLVHVLGYTDKAEELGQAMLVDKAGV